MFPAQYYYPVFIHLLLLFSLIHYSNLTQMSVHGVLNVRKGDVGITIFTILFIVLIGLRPISGRYFGDTINYANDYYLLQNGINTSGEHTSEWLFYWMMSSCASLMNVQYFFLIIEVCYVVPILIVCKRMMRNNTIIAMLFCMGAFSFFTYGTNGIRNGLACSLVLLSFSYILGNTKSKIIAGLLCFCAYNIHNSTVLPIICMIASCFYRNTKYIYLFWLGSILISTVAGGVVDTIFSGLGFDDRLKDYLENTDDDALFSRTGFRWDFLLYSAMPVWLGGYVVFKKKILEKQYLLLLHTYVLSNAFWVMLIHASYSNRFAYLSWFMYPVVLAYPLLKFPIWKNQGNKVGLILFAHVLFTYLMWIRG